MRDGACPPLAAACGRVAGAPICTTVRATALASRSAGSLGDDTRIAVCTRWGSKVLDSRVNEAWLLVIVTARLRVALALTAVCRDFASADARSWAAGDAMA